MIARHLLIIDRCLDVIDRSKTDEVEVDVVVRKKW